MQLGGAVLLLQPLLTSVWWLCQPAIPPTSFLLVLCHLESHWIIEGVPVLVLAPQACFVSSSRVGRCCCCCFVFSKSQEAC